MFDELKIKSVYTSNEDDIVKDFYVPILKEAKTFDRTSAYFSAKALAKYAEGLEFFRFKNNKYRLIISKDISEDDYNQIKLGYKIKESINQEMIESLNENLSLLEEQRISNLAYFISIGVLELKIAFKKEGIFHDKCGIFTDEKGNKICFRGSNNETEAAINSNYESFQVICSWLDSNNFYSKGIKKSQDEFEELWNNENDEVIVVPAHEVVIKNILKYNKGKVIAEEVILSENSFILDYDNELLLHENVENLNWLESKTFYKINLQSKVKNIKNKVIHFNNNLTYSDFIKIDNILKTKLKETQYGYYTTNRFDSYIEEKNLYIEQRAKLGIELKTDISRLEEKYNKFKEIVNNSMIRKLREKQARDAFFMLAMSKSANFSVPGSGKTTSALAVYSYLKYKKLVRRVVMIGPKNSFGSWIDEFQACFGEKEKLKLFNIQDRKYLNNHQRKLAISYETGGCNLLLFNYESLGPYLEEIIRLVADSTLLVLDEVHKVKAIDGKRAEFTMKITEKSKYTIIMTGTPIPNSYLDLYNPLHFLFNDEYKDFFGFDISKLRNPSLADIDYINKKIQPFFCRTSKKELKVPEANKDLLLNINTTLEEQKIFDILCNKYRNNKLVLFMRLLQLESNPKMLLEKLDLNDFSSVLDLTDGIDNIDYVDYKEEFVKLVNNINITSKKNKCIDLTKNLVKKNKKIIIWCIFKDSIYSINKILNDEGIKSKYIMGEVDLDERINILNNFKNGKFDVLITNPHTLAESVSLHMVCHDAIYFEYGYNLVHLLQSKDRIHRLGLPENQYTQYYFLQDNFEIYGDTYSLDNQIYLRLQKKEKTMLEAIDNQVLEKVYTPEEDLEIIFKKLF